MIEIKHRTTRRVLHTVEADTLSRADLSEAKMSNADLSGANLCWATLPDGRTVTDLLAVYTQDEES